MDERREVDRERQVRRRAVVATRLIGLGLLAGAAVIVLSTLAFRSKSAVMEGVVVGRELSTGTGDLNYKFRIEWTLNGERRRFLTAVASPRSTYDIGETVTVRYPPANPNGARVESFTEDWFLPLVLAFIAAGFLRASAKLRPSSSLSSDGSRAA